MNIKPFIDYISLEKKMSKHTVRAYKDDVNSFSNFCNTRFQILSIDDASYTIIRSWMVYLVGNKLSNATINRKISSLKAYYKYLFRIHVITHIPFSKHRKLKVPKRIQLPFSEKEMSDCFQENIFPESFEGSRDKLILELLYSSGIRRAELVTLNCSGLNLREKYIKVLGKKNKERLVPLTQKCIEAISAYLHFRKLFLETDALFVTRKGKRIGESLVYRKVKENMGKVSSKLKISPHIIRHTMATHVLNNGANLNDVKELLGHTSLVATQIYTHNSISELKKQYKKAHPRNKKIKL